MISKIVEMIIEEAKARPHTDIPNALLDINTEVSKIILRLSFHVQGISYLDIPEAQQQIFINHILAKPMY